MNDESLIYMNSIKSAQLKHKKMLPYLMLDFSYRDEPHINDMGIFDLPSSRKKIHISMLDVDASRVIEMDIKTPQAEQLERNATDAEIGAARSLFSNAGVHAERAKYDREVRKNQNLAKENQQLRAELEELKERDFDQVTREMLADALDVRIEELALNKDAARYQQAKRIYKRLTGKKWVDDGLDDEEGEIQI